MFTDDDVNAELIAFLRKSGETEELLRRRLALDLDPAGEPDARDEWPDLPPSKSRSEWRTAIRDGDPNIVAASGAPARRQPAEDYTAAFRAWMRNGEQRLDPRTRAALMTGYAEFEGETRALGEATGAAGGYLVPAELAPRIVRKLAAYSGILESGRATMFNTRDGRALSFPVNDDTGNVGAIVAENAAVGTITDPVFSQVALPVRTYTSKPLRISWQMLADNGIENFEGYIADLLAVRIGRAMAGNLIDGDPTATPAEPEGMLTNVTTGVTAAATNAVTYDELVDLTLAVDPAYHVNGAWLVGPSFRGLVMKLKDDNSNPIWSDPREGAPARLLGYPVVLDANMPAVAASALPALFGDFSAYAIRRAELFMLRLTERYAEYGQVGFLMFARFGAVPLVADAYQALAMAAS